MLFGKFQKNDLRENENINILELAREKKKNLETRKACTMLDC